MKGHFFFKWLYTVPQHILEISLGELERTQELGWLMVRLEFSHPKEVSTDKLTQGTERPSEKVGLHRRGFQRPHTSSWLCEVTLRGPVVPNPGCTSDLSAKLIDRSLPLMHLIWLVEGGAQALLLKCIHQVIPVCFPVCEPAQKLLGNPNVVFRTLKFLNKTHGGLSTGESFHSLMPRWPLTWFSQLSLWNENVVT